VCPGAADATPFRATSCPAPPWTADGAQADARFGTVAPAGDVNGDGYDDVIIGAYNMDDPEVDEGVVWLYLGSPTGLPAAPAWSAGSGQAGARMADKLSGAGDVNGDGYDDIIVGAAFYDHGQTDEGAAFLYLGSPTGLPAQPDWTSEGDQAGAQYGACVQGAGDLNGDGYDDVVVGSWLWTHDQPNEGAAFVFLGSDSGLADTPAWSYESDSDNAVFGYFCTGARDVNADGFDDLVVGARRFSGNGLFREGRVYVFLGSPTGPSLAPDWVRDGGQAGGEFGESVASAGDVDGDGDDELLACAFRYDDPEVDEGVAYLFRGTPAGLELTPAWTAEKDQAGAYYGYHLDTAGDVNGDGYDDIVLSASQFDVGGFTDAGGAWVYLGSPTGLAAVPAWFQPGDQTGGGLGNAARGVGDVNGDGLGDVGTGALYHDQNGLTDAGRAYVFLGCREATTEVPAPTPPRVALAAHPSVFARSTRFAFTLPAAGHARLALHDLSGRRIRTLVDAPLAEGSHALEWDGRDDAGARVPAGVYWARLERGPGDDASVRVVRME
jgi:hypothetical protein